MTRKEAREFLMQVFFQMDANDNYNIDDEKKYFADLDDKGQAKYCSEMYSLICNKKNEIDELLKKHMRGWTIERMPKTDLAVLRVAVCEMAFMKGIPATVSINEAVELSKKYGTEESHSYVNGILGGVYKDLEDVKSEENRKEL